MRSPFTDMMTKGKHNSIGLVPVILWLLWLIYRRVESKLRLVPKRVLFGSMMAMQSLFHQLAIARNEYELRLCFLDAAGELFGAQAWGFTVLDQDFQIIETDKRGLPDSFVDCYNEVGIPRDPVMSGVIERHAPVHDQLVLSPENWRRSAIYQHVALRYGIEHIMIGPLVGGGHLVGKVYLMRNSQMVPFAAEDLSRLSALCTHLSVCLATLRARAMVLDSSVPNCLTQRELQIADLVAQGMKTVEISATLGITQNSVKQALKRMFIKLNVSTRAEMVAQLRGVPTSHRVSLSQPPSTLSEHQ